MLQNLDTLKQEIKQKQHELKKLEQAFLQELNMEQSVSSALAGNIYYTKYSSLFVLLVSIVILCAVLFSGAFVQLDQSPKTLGFALPQIKMSCARYNGNYGACVKAQHKNLGCAWLATCSKCISEQDDAATMCGN